MEKFTIELHIEITNDESDNEAHIRKSAHNDLLFLKYLADFWGFEFHENAFWFYPDEEHETRGHHKFGLVLKLRHRVQGLSSVAYLIQNFESTCRLINLQRPYLKLDLTVI